MNDNGIVDMNIIESDRPLDLQQLLWGQTFIVTSKLMHMLTTRGLFVVLPEDAPHTHISKLNFVNKIFICQPDWDMNVIGLRLFFLLLIGDDVNTERVCEQL